MKKASWTVDQVRLEVARIKARIQENPPFGLTEFEAFRIELKILPPEWEGLALECYNTGFQYGAAIAMQQKRDFTRETVVAGYCMLFIPVGLLLIFVVREPTEVQLRACAAMIAFGIAAAYVFLPGAMQTQGQLKEIAIFKKLEFKAAGAAAIFLVVYMLLRYTLLRP